MTTRASEQDLFVDVELLPFEADGEAPTEADLTDVGNGSRLARRSAGRLLFVPGWGFRVYDPPRGVWRDDEGAVARLAKETARSWYEAAAREPEDRLRGLLARHARSSESARAQAAMLKMAESELSLQAAPDDFDADPLLLNAANGVVDLRTGKLLEHSADFRATRVAGTAYEPAATCPAWGAHLWRIFDGDEETIAYLQRLLGYCLTGSIAEQTFAIFWGTGANGKSVTVETAARALGDYRTSAEVRTFMATHSDRPRNDLARLAGARLVTASEAGAGWRLDEALIKAVTGGERLVTRFLHREHFEFAPQFKLILSTNHKPEIGGSDLGIWRRPHLVPFTVTIPEAEQDRHMPERLAAELPGILAWMVRGAREWQERGLDPPATVREATAAYRAEQDVIAAFLAECTAPNDQAEPTLYDIHRAFVRWARRSGEEELSTRRLGGALREHGVKIGGRESGTGRTKCRGIALLIFTEEDTL